MIRIFSVLACLSVALLGVTLLLGWLTGDFNGASDDYGAALQTLNKAETEAKEQRPRDQEKISDIRKQRGLATSEWKQQEGKALTHIWFGIAAALVTVLVNSIAVTYFIGTGRWVREVVETYGFDRDWIARADGIKRRTFPWALGGMLTAVVIIALGAAAHPGTARLGTAAWVLPHWIGAMLGTAFIAYSYFVQSGRIAAYYQVIEDLVAEVQTVRKEKGLDTVDSSGASPTAQATAGEAGE